MASLPSGSNKILEVHTERVSAVIKSKKSQVFIDQDAIMSQDSTVDITAVNLRRVKIDPCDIDANYESSSKQILLCSKRCYSECLVCLILRQKLIWHQAKH